MAERESVIVCDNGSAVRSAYHESGRFFAHLLVNLDWFHSLAVLFLLPVCVLQSLKCGFAGSNFPSAVIPCVVGRRMVRFDDSADGEDMNVSATVIQAARPGLLVCYVDSGRATSLAGHHWCRRFLP